MSGHAIHWTFDHGSVRAEAICTAAEDADCRLGCTADCEQWGRIQRHTDTALDGRTVKRYTHDDCTAGMRPGECNVCLFLNADPGYIDELCVKPMTITIGTMPIDPEWDGDQYLWRPAPSVEELIEASSLGTVEATAARESVPPEVGTALALAAKYLGRAKAAEIRERDLRSRLDCVVEATWWDRGYEERIAAIRGMCDLTTNGMTPMGDGEQTVADLIARAPTDLAALVEEVVEQ